MAQVDSSRSTKTGIGVWIFRVLLLVGAAFMAYTWFQPWWTGDFVVIQGAPDMVLHPWGVEAVSQVRTNVDESLFQMPFPDIFAGFMWVYFAVAMLGLIASLFVTQAIKIGPFRVPVALIIILFFGISFAASAGIAYEIGTLKAAASGANFIGKSNVLEPATGAKVKMTSKLELGFWLTIASGGFLTLLGLVRFLFVRKPKAAA